VYGVPALGFVVASKLGRHQSPSSSDLLARRTAHLTVASPALFVLLGVVLYLLHVGKSESVLWSIFWLTCLAAVASTLRGQTAETATPIPANPLSLRIAHGTSALIDQTLDLSAHPVIYSHGQASSTEPYYTQRLTSARSIHLPVARKVAQKGGVVGIWANGGSYSSLDRYADALLELAEALGAAHVGVGTDMDGMTRMVVPSYREFFDLAELMAKRGVGSADLDNMLGGNYIRVLKTALAGGQPGGA